MLQLRRQEGSQVLSAGLLALTRLTSHCWAEQCHMVTPNGKEAGKHTIYFGAGCVAKCPSKNQKSVPEKDMKDKQLHFSSEK